MATKKASKKKSSTSKRKGSGPSKSDFIREKLKAGLSAADIIKAGAGAKMTIAPSFVYKLKSKLSGGGGKKTSGPKKKGGRGSASDFVRSLPASMSAKEVVAAGAKKGLKFSEGLVYQTRAYDKKRRGGSKSKPGPKSKDFKFQVFPGGGGDVEEQFKKLLASIGIDRARALIDEAVPWFRVLGMTK